MKHRLMIVPVLLAGLISACCAKVKCASGEMNRMDVYGYTPQELAHVTIVAYEKGSAYGTPIDSTATYAQEQEGDHYIFSALFRADRDYKIRLQDTGDEFRLAQISTQTDKCKVNGPFCGQEIEKVTGYSLNGTQTVYDGVAVKLVKP